MKHSLKFLKAVLKYIIKFYCKYKMFINNVIINKINKLKCLLNIWTVVFFLKKKLN